MDAETRDLFESSLLELAKSRSREGRLIPASGSGQAKNPFCGDEVAVDLRLRSDDAGIAELGYEAKACSLCVASAELLSDWVERAEDAPTLKALEALHEGIQATLKSGENAPDGFAALASVTPFRARHKCVTLPIEAALTAGHQARERREEQDERR